MFSRQTVAINEDQTIQTKRWVNSMAVLVIWPLTMLGSTCVFVGFFFLILFHCPEISNCIITLSRWIGCGSECLCGGCHINSALFSEKRDPRQISEDCEEEVWRLGGPWWWWWWWKAIMSQHHWLLHVWPWACCLHLEREREILHSLILSEVWQSNI